MTVAADHLTRVRVTVDLDVDLSVGADGPSWMPLAEWDARELSDALLARGDAARVVELKVEAIG